MPQKIIERKSITIPQVRQLLENLGRDLNDFQRKTLDYTINFSKISFKDAEKLLTELVESFSIDIKEATQMANCMPETVEELRTFLPRHKVIEASKLEKMLELLNKHRK